MSTFTETREAFLSRDQDSLNRLSSTGWGMGCNGAPSESNRLQFLEGRVNDLCAIVAWLLTELDKRDQQAALDSGKTGGAPT